MCPGMGAFAANRNCVAIGISTRQYDYIIVFVYLVFVFTRLRALVAFKG